MLTYLTLNVSVICPFSCLSDYQESPASPLLRPSVSFDTQDDFESYRFVLLYSTRESDRQERK